MDVARTLKGEMMSAAPKGQTVVFEVHPFYVCYKEKDGKYRLYKKNDDGTWPNQLGKSKEGYHGLQELQAKAKEKQSAYVKELESKNVPPPTPAPEEVKQQELGKTFETQVELTTNKADEEQAFLYPFSWVTLDHWCCNLRMVC